MLLGASMGAGHDTVRSELSSRLRAGGHQSVELDVLDLLPPPIGADTASRLCKAGYRPVLLCGRDRRLRQRLAGTPGFTALGWVYDMPGLLAACY